MSEMSVSDLATIGYTQDFGESIDNPFVGQMTLAKSLTSSDLGISYGLFNQAYSEMFLHYYVNFERAAITDKNVDRNINISFQNKSAVAVDLMCFIMYSDTFVIDCESVLIKQ